VCDSEIAIDDSSMVARGAVSLKSRKNNKFVSEEEWNGRLGDPIVSLEPWWS
jgi:hypothetical protein